MKNFYRLTQNINVVPIMAAIKSQPDLWDENTLRTEHPGTAHAQVSDIWLRFNEVGQDVARVVDEHESVNYRAWDKLPQVQPIIFDLMRTVQGIRLGRVLITKLEPGRNVLPHVDGGSHAEYYQRYHLILQNEPGSIFRCGSEIVTMKAGELWWFDNNVEHEVINNSGDDRITMIVDIKC